jgi:DNA-binding response OmpR family regulator
MAKIVIVENDTDIAPLLEQLLAFEGYETVIVTNPLRAMDIIRAEEPAMVYLDVSLSPSVDGFMVLKLLRAESDVPVMMCSGFDVEDRCLAEGANAFLLKPFAFEDLIAGVNEAMQGSGK